MEYSLLILVDDQELAINISDYMKSNDVDSYASQAAEYGSEQWGVYVDESKAAIAQDLLNSYQEPASDQDSGYRPNWIYGNNNASGQFSTSDSSLFSSSSSSGSSHKWWYYLLIGLVAASVRFYFKHKDDFTHNSVQYIPTMTAASRYSNIPVKMPNGFKSGINNDSTDVESLPKITIKDIKEIVEESRYQFTKDIKEGFVDKRLSMKGSTIIYYYTLKDGYFIMKMDTWKKEAAKELLQEINSYKPIYGDDVLDQFTKLGVTFNYRFYHEGEKTPYKTVTIPMSYIKKFDKS